MELNDLKRTWDNISSGRQLNETQLKGMLEKRTSNLIERIERNIRIGFGLLLIFLVFLALDDLYLSPRLLKDMEVAMKIPSWLLFLNVFSYTLIFTTFIYFVIKYYRVKKSCKLACDLKNTLVKILETLNIYRKLFLLALVSLSITMALGFTAGLYQESLLEFQGQGLSVKDILMSQLILEVFIGLIFIFGVVGGIFLLLRWGFRRLYGNYYHDLFATLKELQEMDE